MVTLSTGALITKREGNLVNKHKAHKMTGLLLDWTGTEDGLGHLSFLFRTDFNALLRWRLINPKTTNFYNDIARAFFFLFSIILKEQVLKPLRSYVLRKA